MKRLLFFLLAIKCHTIAFSQASPEVRSVIPPSPETANLFRFLDVPVNHSTGATSISVPIYQVQSGSLTVPISISYHAGGRKVVDDTGPVGLGWSLNAGGTISRTIYGKPDEMSYFPFNGVEPASALNNHDDFDYLQELYNPAPSIPNGGLDCEYDIYSYSFGSYSGRFVISDDKQTLHMMPLKPLKWPTPNGNYDVFPFLVIDDMGNEYLFGETESYDGDGDYGGAVTGLLLTRIISANKKDTITFTYQGFSKMNGYPTEKYTRYDNIYDAGTVPQSVYQNSYFSSLNTEQRVYIVKRLKEINFREGKVKFNLDGSTDRVGNIQLLNKDGIVLKTIQLVMSRLDNAYSISHPDNFKLDTLKFKDRNNQVIEKYAFDYNGSGDFNKMSRDFWGYRNSSGQTHGVPTYNNVEMIAPNYSGVGWVSVGSGANRNSSLASEAGVLKKVTYPTGGTTEFTYEMNRFHIGSTVIDGPGLRIREIKTSDKSGLVSYKTYTYGVNESGYGEIPINPGMMDMSYETRVLTNILWGTFSDAQGYRKRTWSSEALPDLSYRFSEPVYYPQVTEYAGTTSNNTGKTVYSFQLTWNNGSLTTGGWYPTPYLPGGFGANMSVDNTLSPRVHIREYNLWDNNHLSSESYYKKTGPSTYQLVKAKGFGYTTQVTDTLRGTHLYKFIECLNGTEEVAAEDYSLPVFVFDDYFMYVGSKHLTSIGETEFGPNGNITNITTYNYNNQHLVAEKRQVISTGDERIIQTKYPPDFPSTPIYQDMTNRNMLSYSIEETELKNSTFLKATRNTFNNYGNHIIMPITTETKQGASAYETRVRFHTYDDRGNIVSLSKENDSRTSYIWGYNKTYPIAEIANAGTLVTAYTSFEVNSPGNWTIASAARNTSDAITGKQCYELSGGALSLTGLDPAKTYILSFWAKPGASLTATGQQSTVQGVSRVGWNQWEKTISGVSSITLSGSGLIDEVRLYPKGALMNTYTYEPLLGMINKCDQRNVVTYYEYDAANRLSLIRDQDKNIIRKICYNYSGQQEDCSGTPTAPLWQLTGTTRCKACPQNASYISKILERQLRDVNPQSPTYNTLIWADYGEVSSCSPPAAWQNTATPQQCQKDASNNNTGWLIQEQRDMNPCSPTYNQLRWVQASYNTTACPATFYSISYTGYYTKQCDPGYQGSQVYVNIPAGAYTSTVSQFHANSLAQQAAQAYANTHGTCNYLGDIYFNYTNNGYEGFYIDFYNTVTGITYSYYMYNNNSGSIGPVPSGNYNISIYNGSYTYNYTFSTCGGSSYGMEAQFYNVPLSPSCTSINIDF
jgi:hypothetical protein